MRMCACGCGQPLVGQRSDAKYRSDACRVRASKRRARVRQQRSEGVPVGFDPLAFWRGYGQVIRT